ncbi:hypothetical protein F4558_002853 [Micromonospora profundi]|uniref:hypothetical protein n=1 Tax=Micromonospora profundi TaxID=1420889 RepID=UPI00143C4A88|nr:hypothetical protein [Micromonospora profundi]NJC13027.1 hypothetical protein [Micromonospora profundi]
MNHWEIIASFVFGLAVNEMTDLSPWAARRLVRWAAYHWTTDPEIAAGYAEEWTAIVEERPGKLFKLATAVQFAIGAAGRAAPRTATAIKFAVRRELASVEIQEARSAVPLGRVLLMLAVSSSATFIALTYMFDPVGFNLWVLGLFVAGPAVIAGLVVLRRRRRRHGLK